MITKEQAEELRRLIGAHTAAQVSFALCGEVSHAYAEAAVTGSCGLLEFIRSITEGEK